DHKDPRFRDRCKLLVEAYDQRPQILAGPARAPVLEDQIGNAGVGEARTAVEGRYAGDADDLLDAWRLAGHFADGIEHTLGAIERGAVWQLHRGQQVEIGR